MYVHPQGVPPQGQPLPFSLNKHLMAVKECGSTKVKGGLLIPFERSFESTSNMMAEYIPSEQQGRRGGGEEGRRGGGEGERRG